VKYGIFKAGCKLGFRNLSSQGFREMKIGGFKGWMQHLRFQHTYSISIIGIFPKTWNVERPCPNSSEIRGMKAPFQNIAIIGGGNLGSAIAEGLLQTPGFAPSTLTVTRRRSTLLAHLEAKGVKVHSDNGAAAAQADLLLLVVQPSQMAGLLAELRPFPRPGQIVVSLATGFSLVEIKEALQLDLPIYRAMPNTAVALRESMTCIATKDSDTGRQSQVIAFFRAIGQGDRD
jgi:hypothetical protein